MKILQFDNETIEKSFEQAENELLTKLNAHIIQYTDFDITTFDANNKALLNKITANSIVYCLWLGNQESTIAPIYIGHAHRNISRQRMRAHLTKKNKATGAQLEKIKIALERRQVIALSFLKIEPQYMRKALEEWLIEKHSASLSWNKSGKIR
jgi:hypothetical protein